MHRSSLTQQPTTNRLQPLTQPPPPRTSLSPRTSLRAHHSAHSLIVSHAHHSAHSPTHITLPRTPLSDLLCLLLLSSHSPTPAFPPQQSPPASLDHRLDPPHLH
ncbi:hypothetical protein ACFE04_031062 [Oxalis oulophora]